MSRDHLLDCEIRSTCNGTGSAMINASITVTPARLNVFGFWTVITPETKKAAVGATVMSYANGIVECGRTAIGDIRGRLINVLIDIPGVCTPKGWNCGLGNRQFWLYTREFLKVQVMVSPACRLIH